MDQVPKKNARRGVKKKTAALLLAAAMLLLGAAVYFLRRPAVPPPPDRAPRAALLSRPQEEIDAVSVSGEGESYTLARAGEDFVLQGRETLPLRADLVREILSVCADLKAEETVADTAREAVALSDFSLDPALRRVTVRYRDGREETVLVGCDAPAEIPQRYCMRAGDTEIVTILTGENDVLFCREEALRAFNQPQLRGDLLDRITVAGEGDLDLRYTPSGWLLERPFRYPLSVARTDALIRQIEAMGFQTYLGPAEENDLAACGLDSPALIVSLIQAATVLTGSAEEGDFSLSLPEKTYTLRLGREDGAGGVFVWWEGGVYRASNFLLGFWKDLRADDLLLRSPVNFLVGDLRQVDFSMAGETASYAVEMVEGVTENNQIATDEYGRVLYDAQVRRGEDGPIMDAAAFLSWYQRLAALAPAGETPAGYAPAGEAVCRVTVSSSALRRDIAFFPYDALHSAMAVDGVCLFYVENSALKALLPLP